MPLRRALYIEAERFLRPHLQGYYSFWILSNGLDGTNRQPDKPQRRAVYTRAELQSHGFTEDVANIFAADVALNVYLSDYMNALARSDYESRGQTYTQEHRSDDIVVKGPNNQEERQEFGRVFKREGRPEGDYHFSLEEMKQVSRELNFQFHAHGVGLGIALHKQLALPGDKFNPDDQPKYVTAARAKLGALFEATVSRTITDVQQVIVPEAKENMEYGKAVSVEQFFSWLKADKFTP